MGHVVEHVALELHDGGNLAGQTYLILGKALGWAMDTDLSDVDASFWGEDGGDVSGRAVSGGWYQSSCGVH